MTDSRMSRLEKKAARTVADLRQFYKIGLEAKEAMGNYGDKKEQEIAEKHGRSPSSVAQARSFAKLIEPAEFEHICQLRNSKGAAFGPGLATKLAPFKKRKDR
jgi:hypothetical protein